MAISITIKKRSGKEYIYIIDGFRDPATKRPTTRTLVSFGNKEKLLKENPDFMKVVEAKLSELRCSSAAYSAATENSLRNRVSVTDGDMERGNYYSLSHAVYHRMWQLLGLDSYLGNVTHNYKLDYDLEKTVFFGASTRIIAPDSKRATVAAKNNYLIDFSDIELNHMYRSLDELAQRKEALIKRINQSIGKLYKRDLTIAFYDVTTFYFESFVDDTNKDEQGHSIKWKDLSEAQRKDCGLRARGMSKEHRTQETQVVLGLLIDSEGVPITYEIFPGNTAETYTILDVVKQFRTQYEIKDVTIVADSGLNSLFNLDQLQKSGFKFIVGYPPYVKLDEQTQEEFLKTEGWNCFYNEEQYDDLKWGYKEMDLEIEKITNNHEGEKVKVKLNARLIGTYSERRYRHDIHELEMKYAKAKSLIEQGQAAVNASNKSGYKAFVTTNSTKSTLNTELYEKRKKWCGYMALLTNITDLKPMDIYRKLRQLWRIEENFRVMKTNLSARPVYVWTPQHIRGHFVLNYIALVMLRLLQRELGEKGIFASEAEIAKALESVKVTRLSALKKAAYHLYSCSNIPGTCATLTDSKGQPMLLRELADGIFTALGLEIPKAIETSDSLRRKLKIKMPIRDN